MNAPLNVYTCPKCGRRSNALVCISCLHAEVEAERAQEAKTIKERTTMKYRIVVGETGDETGDIVETKATTERGARIVLGRELAKYGGDGWGFIEIDLYDDGRWDRDGVRGKGE